MAYIGKSPTGTGVRQRYYFTATGGETSISGADDNSRTLTFSDGEYVDVYLNGILLVADTDYNTTTTNTISSLTALNTGDIVEVVVYDIFTVPDAVSKANGGTFNGNVGVSGNITATGTVSATSYHGDGSNLSGINVGIVQVTSTQVTATSGFSTASTSYVTDTSASQFPTLSITPSSSSSKIMIMFRIGMQNDAGGQIENTIYRNSTTDLSNGNTYGLSFSGGSTQGWFNNIITWVDSPNTTSPVRYTWYSRSEGGQTVTPVHFGTTWSAVLMELP